MRNPLLTILTLCALALATAPFAESAYMEGGKPVTKRHQAEPKKSVPEEKIQEEAPGPGAEKPKEAEVPPEKTKETPPPPAEAKPQSEPVPAAPTPPVPVAVEKEEIPPEPAPDEGEANAKPKKERFGENPWAPSSPKDAKEEKASPSEKKPTKRHPWSLKPVPGEKDETREDVPEKQKGPNKNTLLLYAFYGISAGDVEVDVSGLELGYERILSDSRCAECGLGNVISLACRLGIGEGESEDGGQHYGSYYSGYGNVQYDNVTLGFATVGLRWQHQLGRNFAFVLGVFGGLEYLSAKWNSQEYSSWGSGYSRHGEESGVSFCCGGNAALLFEFGERHGIELGMDFYASSADFDDVPGWEAPSWIMAKIGYRCSF
ncbi:MAG: hypothetical protein ACI4P3_01120 [Candidatus Spyradosoma sp.]